MSTSPGREAMRSSARGPWPGHGRRRAVPATCARPCARCSGGLADGRPVAPSRRAGAALPELVDTRSAPTTKSSPGFGNSGRSPPLVAGLPARSRLRAGPARGTKTQSALCASRGGSFEAPLLASAFLAALARLGGRLGLGERSAAMRAVFSPLLDDAIVSRRSKATFGDVFWGPASRQFANDWDGGGLGPRWVDAGALRLAWTEQRPVYGAALPLQAAWLATQARSTAASPGGSSPPPATWARPRPPSCATTSWPRGCRPWGRRRSCPAG